MKQEAIAGIILAVIGLTLLIAPSGRLWAITEKWKTRGGAPSRAYGALMKALGAVFAAVGVYLTATGL